MDEIVLNVLRVVAGFQSVAMGESAITVETVILMDISNKTSRLVLSILSGKVKARSTSLGARFEIFESILKNNSKILAMNGCYGEWEIDHATPLHFESVRGTTNTR